MKLSFAKAHNKTMNECEGAMQLKPVISFFNGL